ncbi:hypothetical protein CH296_00500 [Rhodococcus sp. 14-2496-1d]|uniref:hypothetical protein n=1 Tax=Rhodococcus sp. 14-2496-1d TaxID=2023146 RepID=UPI000B9A24CC|nr:hypothetical protein [Rhodococcus sp. 14-2496-1d]OZF40770.1 hypothetical protein CH296_00500 [Rhodococcus sp. 14-2496-1d]
MHALKSSKVDISNSRPHELEQNVATVQVGIWCRCGRRVQGTQKISNKDCDDDAALRQAVLSAESKAKSQLSNHIESEPTS